MGESADFAAFGVTGKGGLNSQGEFYLELTKTGIGPEGLVPEFLSSRSINAARRAATGWGTMAG
jgi:hypothetical protein